MADRIEIHVDRDGWTRGLQLNILQLDEKDRGWGYRLHGPKYNGSSTNLVTAELTARDATEIRKKLDAVFPDGGLEQARRIAVELENEVTQLRDRLRCGDARALREAAERFEAACPDHGDSPEVGVVCRCDSALLLRRMAAVLEVMA